MKKQPIDTPFSEIPGPVISREERRRHLARILYAEKWIEAIWIDKETGKDLDKYDVFKSEIKPETNCWSEKLVPGYFHHHVASKFQNGKDNTVVIEKEDGDMITCGVDRIKFVD